ncbi:peptidase M15 [Prauserella marina]|uniref:D-alanyl-D-alanine carboxypeptidase (Penicillin-binding protein 5/6) n=1 Tax=Prauserella marina TaxID=530584 RepID=A0A222VKH0_9PSEU|nr:serine hydrolase [Prauserella marina]ASR34201.1 peptidase M15 [Prauserella marina]PWV70880.1 D-alanyl-D-alanine carboxypeptidase (penicillin-binding protein 5/6) [Prauserella marina]SDE01841.1 D-alanyl-D-alanine carboxypeptidase (penicillin-binding protein 5/6) [Prauserella marina]
MRSAVPARVLIVALLAALFGTSGLPALAQQPGPPEPPYCEFRELPPPPVDTSEQPPPGVPSPAPLPVPASPAGGERMSECGVVIAEGVPAPPEPQTAASWMVQNLDTGEVLAAKDPHGRQRPASLIKTLLALVVLEQLDPERVVVGTKQDAEQECTCVGIVEGGEYTVGQLMNALLMRSGNDVAHALAGALGGTQAAVGKMNDLAARLGAADTRAATPSGLDGPGMTTSVYDMSLVFASAMKQPGYAEAVGRQHMDFPGGPGKPPYPIYNDNQLWPTYAGFIGGKTGFTDDSRHTYAGAADRDGTRIGVVLLRAEQKPIPVGDQAARLLDYGFSLAATGTPAVGDLNEAPAVGGDTSDGSAHGAQDAGEEDGKDDPFGTTGWIITLVVILIVAIGMIVAHRKGVLIRRE